MYDPIVSRETSKLISAYESSISKKIRFLDPLAVRLIERLIELGHLKSKECYVEWEGVEIHGLVPVLHSDGTVLNVYESGAVEEF